MNSYEQELDYPSEDAPVSPVEENPDLVDTIFNEISNPNFRPCEMQGCNCNQFDVDANGVCTNCYHTHKTLPMDELQQPAEEDIEDPTYTDPNTAYANNWLCLSNAWSCLYCGCINYGNDACANCKSPADIKAPFNILTRVTNVEQKYQGDDDEDEQDASNKYNYNDPSIPEHYRKELQFYRTKAHDYKQVIHELKRNYTSLQQQHQKLQILSVDLLNEKTLLSNQINTYTRALGMGGIQRDVRMNNSINNCENLQSKLLSDEVIKLRRENEKYKRNSDKVRYEFQLQLEKQQASHAREIQRLTDANNEKILNLEKKIHALENDKEQLHSKVDNMKQHSLELSLFGNAQDKDIKTIANNMKALRKQIDDENQLVQQYKDLVAQLEHELQDARSPETQYAVEMKGEIKPLLDNMDRIKNELVSTAQVIFQKKFTGFDPSDILNNVILYTIKFISSKWKQNVNGAINALKGQLHLAKDRIHYLEEFAKKNSLELDPTEKDTYKNKFMEIEKSKYPILQALKDLDSHHAIRKTMITTQFAPDVSVAKIEELFDQYEEANLQLGNLLQPLSGN